jgi:hypothetical protein
MEQRMLRNYIAATIVCSFALTTSIAPAQEMTRELVEKIKSSAVYIFTKIGQGGGTGSGWVIEKDSKGVLVVTNRHVISNDEGQIGDEVICYFYPGTDREKSYKSQVIVVDPDEDLAVLRVEAPDLPDAMPLVPDVNALFETQKVTAVGFPKGEDLRFGQRAPGVTMSETTISGMRRFDDNTLARITINGGVTNGNSGGMTVNSKGEVVGVVVAMHSQANNIAIIIPITQVTSLFRGKPSRVIGIPAVSADPTKVVVDFYVNCFDPKGSINQLEFFQGPASVIQGLPADQLVMTRKVMAGMSAPVAMNYDKSRAQAACRVVFNAADINGKDVVIQVSTTRSDSTRTITPPVAVRIDPKQQISFSPGYKDATNVVQSSSGMKGVTGDTKAIKMKKEVTDVVVAGSGRYLLIRAEEEVAVVDLTNRERVKTLSIADGSYIAGGSDCFIIYNRFTNKFERWSLANMSKEKEVDPPKDLHPAAIAMGHSSTGPLFVYEKGRYVGSGDAKLSCAFLDTQSFKGKVDVFYDGPLPQAASGLGGGGIATPGGGGDSFGFLTHAEIRAAGNGSCFAMWRPFTFPQGMAVFRNKRVKGKISMDTDDDTGLYVSPSTDGEMVCTILGVKSSDLKRNRMSGICLPCTDTQHIMSIGDKGFELRDISSGATLQTFVPPFPFEPNEKSRKSILELALDKCLVCSPHYDMMAIVLPGSDTVGISKLGLKLTSAPSASSSIPPVNIANGMMRTWTNPAGRQIKAKLISVSADGVELQLEKDNSKVKVTFDKLSDADVKYAKFEGDKARGVFNNK